ncbi:hypothetical protein A0J61_07765 [Choanephora cucurbitarum]|uniref:Uncharacterized protein n=1 Tax=Choanephora cucurbitarum TaxID=101091 RepID=A0A1C7N526_9FUNG|nr:hypothetical protein A0J61_07765 [Choanephora cucurbitarum]
MQLSCRRHKAAIDNGADINSLLQVEFTNQFKNKSFKERYPIWSSRVQYAADSQQLIDWKDFVTHLIRQQKATQHFSFEFVQEQLCNFRKRKRTELEQEEQEYRQKRDCEASKSPFWIQDPLVVDIDRITKQGVVATGKHRKLATGHTAHSEHKILFWEYPSWKLIRTFELVLTPQTLTCQIIGIQSIKMRAPDGSIQKVRFFSLAVGVALVTGMEAENEDRVDIWKSLFVYRLFDNGDTQCVAHVKVVDLFLGREVFLFSDTSWSQSNDGKDNDDSNFHTKHPSPTALKDWMKIVSPENVDYDPCFTVFMLAIGPIYDHITGCVQIARFDIRDQHILDPSVTPVAWDSILHQLIPVPKTSSYLWHHRFINNRDHLRFNGPTEMIACIRLGSDVSCMIHFKYPPYLNHLICTGSYQDDELSVYDWRFGIKVGSLPWKTTDHGALRQHLFSQRQTMEREEDERTVVIEDTDENEVVSTASRNLTGIVTTRFNDGIENDVNEAAHFMDENDDALEAIIDVRPWGLESTLVLPPFWCSSESRSRYHDALAECGFRLIAVGDNRSDNNRDKLEIKVWDISYLLRVQWDPLSKDEPVDALTDQLDAELTDKFSWWPRRTQELTRMGLNMYYQQLQNQLPSHFMHTTHSYTNLKLPYSPPHGFQSMLLSHAFNKEDNDGQTSGQDEMIPVKYTAYNVLYTSLFLLTEDGKVTVMDIETGKIIGTVDNVAANGNGQYDQVRGIDVNVIGGREVVVTSKEGLLRGTVC